MSCSDSIRYQCTWNTTIDKFNWIHLQINQNYFKLINTKYRKLLDFCETCWLEKIQFSHFLKRCTKGMSSIITTIRSIILIHPHNISKGSVFCHVCWLGRPYNFHFLKPYDTEWMNNTNTTIQHVTICYIGYEGNGFWWI